MHMLQLMNTSGFHQNVGKLHNSLYTMFPDPFLSNAFQGGNFHLKVGGAKSSGNAGDPMLGVAVSGGSRIYKRGRA